MDDLQQRLRRARAACNMLSTDYRTNWTLEPKPELLKPLVKGQDIIEIGYGRDGGLAEYFKELGAGNYLGVDIDGEAFNQSQRYAARNRVYLLDDPIHVLNNNQNKQSIVVSSAVLEDLIIKDTGYLMDLIQAIARHVTKGTPTIHLSGYIEAMNPLFANEGLMPQKGCPEFLCVYERTEPTPSLPLQ